jgi:hypothetical protein
MFFVCRSESIKEQLQVEDEGELLLTRENNLRMTEVLVHS